MRREYVGGAQAARLTTALGGTTGDLTIYCDDLTNWPTGVSGRPFYVVINRGSVSEEKILCSSRSSNTLTVYNDGITIGRGADDTSITSHSINAVIEHVFTATDADEANAFVNTITTTGDLLVYGTSSADRLPVGNDGEFLVADSTSPLGMKWESTSQPSSLDILNPFLLMGA